MDITSCKYVSKNINSMDIKLGVHGYLHADSEWKSDGMSIPYSKLYFIFSGKAMLVHNSKTYDMMPGQVYMIPYGTPHGFYCESKMEKLYFHITVTKPSGGDLFEGLDKIMALDMSMEKMQKIKSLYFDENIGSCFSLKKELYLLVYDFIDKFSINIKPDPLYSDTVSNAISYIRANLSQNISVKKLADKLFVSESMLSKSFSKETGISIGKFIDKEVMIETQRRLLLSDEPIQNISEELGFCDQFYFSKKFKQFCGVPPIKYRKQNRDGM